ncbi:hypothetical protein Ahy_A09g041551 isoform B [Arachis hypogaea]|uniref:Uncharacterized protein n=1 Tax=Arachis hypogaea TaxID=3818 RepID=A0A445BD23_ARAHY|nr:hypothetical protein Ahy_A09g041551 isoform B [Arachis hypogaea]
MAEKLSLLKELDITLCLNVSNIVLEAIGRGCPFLKSSRFNYNQFVIAKNMSNLRHLQLVPTNFNNSGLSAIFDSCPHLKSLDVRFFQTEYRLAIFKYLYEKRNEKERRDRGVKNLNEKNWDDINAIWKIRKRSIMLNPKGRRNIKERNAKLITEKHIL